MQELFSYGRKGIRKFLRENHVAILYTVILHLLVAIVMVFLRVEGLKNDQELGIAVEFEEKSLEEILQEENIDLPAEWLEQLLAEREAASNRAVNRNADQDFQEDISTNDFTRELLEEIERARSEEDREKLEELQAILAAADYVPPAGGDQEEETTEYSGPTTISYEFLEAPLDRGRVHLTVPVYRCQGSGVVRVEVEVRPDGSVHEASIVGLIEGRDQVCFADAALEAARSSRFRVELSGPERHRALITYTFIAQ